MGRIRTIKPEFWQNEVMARLPAETRLLAIALLNHADDHGYFLANPHLVRAACCPFMEASVNDHGTITEASVIIQDMLRELSSIGWIELKTADDGRLLGRVVNFKLHQYVQRPQKSKIAAIYDITGTITERSRNDHGTVSANSVLDQGSGIRDQGTGIREDLIDTPPKSTPSSETSREGKKQSVTKRVGKEFPTGEQNPIPEPLRTPEFLAAWQRWLDFRLAADGRLNPVQQELQLKTCLERGADKAARDLEASILGNSKGQIFDSDRNFSDKPVDPESPVGDEKTNPKRYTPADFLNCWGHYFAATEPPLMTPGRAKAIAAKLRDPWFVEHFPEAVEKASKTDVFNGKGNWKADVDWFLKGDNAVRVWEGSFDKKNPYAGFPGMSP